MTEQRDELRLVPLSRIKPWKGNPRKSFPEPSIANLAESIKVQGVLQPLLLRPVPTDQTSQDVRALKKNLGGDGTADGYEIADGERRFRASTLAGLKVVPAIVRELTEREMFEISLVSEGQREDLSALERADGLQKLVDYFDGKIEAAAAKLGKSPSALRASLRLRQLPDMARKALAEGKLEWSVAELIAARPSPAMREKVASWALKAQREYRDGSGVNVLPSVRQVKDFVRQHCMVELKQAPFNQKEKGLASASACTDCPKRTGNNREEFPEGRADLCTDPPCYRAKVEAWQKRQVETAQANGQLVLDAGEAARLFPYGNRLAYNAPYFDLADQCNQDSSPKQARSYKQLLEPHLQPADVVLCFDSGACLHRLVGKDKALPILRKEHGLFQPGNGRLQGTTTAEDGKARAKRRKELALARRHDELLLAAAESRARAWAQAVSGHTPGLTKMLQAIAFKFIGHLGSDNQAMLLKRLGLKTATNFNGAELLRDAAAKMDFPEVAGLLAELLVADAGLGGYDGPSRRALDELFALDRAAAKKEAADELKEKKATPAAGPTKRPHKAKKRLAAQAGGKR